MHGVIFNQFESYIKDRYGTKAWGRLVDFAGAEKTYLPVQTYSDEEFITLLDAAAEGTASDFDEVLEDFGMYLVPNLVDMYGSGIDEDWGPLELIANTEEQVHRLVRSDGGEPPELDAEMESEDTVVLRYASDRGLCQLAFGILKGVGQFYGESLDITQEECMDDGDSDCVFRITNR